MILSETALGHATVASLLSDDRFTAAFTRCNDAMGGTIRFRRSDTPTAETISAALNAKVAEEAVVRPGGDKTPPRRGRTKRLRGNSGDGPGQGQAASSTPPHYKGPRGCSVVAGVATQDVSLEKKVLRLEDTLNDICIAVCALRTTLTPGPS